jgi:hypothetical protein
LAEESLRRLYLRRPDLRHKHSVTARGPEECKRLFRFTFMADFGLQWRVPSYVRWLHRQDHTVAYEYYRRLLQLLTWRCPGSPLVLKNPPHLANIDAILKAFPDANFIWLHRNPLEVVPSICSLRSTLMRRVPVQVGPGVAWRLADSVAKAASQRERANRNQFHDVKYSDLVKDPLAVAEGAYRRFGYDVTDAMRARMSAWLEANPPNRYGVHRYSLAQYGLDADTVARLFSEYCARFDVEM